MVSIINSFNMLGTIDILYLLKHSKSIFILDKIIKNRRIKKEQLNLVMKQIIGTGEWIQINMTKLLIDKDYNLRKKN